jgi:OOP family OmpA-OmpF porin
MNAMADFTRDIFLTKAPAPALKGEAVVLDGDGDGVPDRRDDCPDSRPGVQVDEHGCWHLIVAADALFDFDKYAFKPQGIKILNRVVAFMQKYSFIDLAINGHTDNFGSMAYNIKLSKRRAMAGVKYLRDKGIAKERISASWHSYSIPKASNKTAAGRALNRRLEFKFSKH